jgi:hypothetical protein
MESGGFPQMPASPIGDFVNGRFRAVKVAVEPRSLERSLRELGWVIEVKPLAGPFALGLGERAG